MSKETGGPAFPREDYQANGHERGFERLGQEGMSLRDYFAAKAMQGWLASYGENDSHPVSNGNELEFATMAYKLADAMIKARSE